MFIYDDMLLLSLIALRIIRPVFMRYTSLRQVTPVDFALAKKWWPKHPLPTNPSPTDKEEKKLLRYFIQSINHVRLMIMEEDGLERGLIAGRCPHVQNPKDEVPLVNTYCVQSYIEFYKCINRKSHHEIRCHDHCTVRCPANSRTATIRISQLIEHMEFTIK